jgi:hypothetical protein
LVHSALIDNNTIKKDGDGKLYVDVTTIPEIVIADGSVALVKLEDVASGTVFYRKTAGSGAPEVQTLETLKADLGLTDINSGDQDLSGYVLKITTINAKALTGNIILTPEDIGAPSGNGTSTGDNTGDETQDSILDKLGLEGLSGLNTGDETYESIVEVFGLEEEVDTFTLMSTTQAQRLAASPNVFAITLPADTTVAGRILGATEGVDYPTGWVLAEGSNPVDIDITHGTGMRVASVTVFSASGTEERQLFGNAAFSGILTPTENILRIESLAKITKTIKIYILMV